MQETGPAAEGHPEPGPVEPTPAWRLRVQDEFKDLSVKIAKLGAVLEAKEAGGCPEIDPVQHSLLIAQHAAMISYQSILFIRLNVETR